MKRITSACLLQTIRFDTTNDANPKAELDLYLSKLDKKKTKYAIVEKNDEADGSIVVKIKKRYNTYNTDGYFD